MPMHKLPLCKWLICCVSSFLILSPHISFAAEPLTDIAKMSNGTWENSYTTRVKGKPSYGLDQAWSIWALDNRNLQVQFDGTYFYSDPGGAPTANTGFTSGIATLDGNVAILRPDEFDAGCRFVLTFKNKTLAVSQKNCEGLFGMRVHAVGAYKKTSSKRPVFSTSP